jgi:DNA-binding CsgD family transcriptional regulator
MNVNHPSRGDLAGHRGVSRSQVEVRVNDMLVTESQAPELRRRRGDLTSSRTVLELVSFLLTRPNSDQTAQHLVLRLMSGHHPRAAIISLFAPDATLHEVGMFGLSPSALEVYRNLALDESTPMTDAVRAREPVVITDAAEVETRYPWIGSHGMPYEPLAVWPLTLPDEYVGGIQFLFTQPPDPDALRADVTGVAAVLALYLSMLTNTAPGPAQAWHPDEGDNGPAPMGAPELRLVRSNGDSAEVVEPDGPTPSREHLTPRQIEILALMGKGLTNSQISSAIGFSESTVGQETLDIYRYFGVHSRRDAVRMASSRGFTGVSSV